MEVKVLIPSFNHAAYIEQTLRSVFWQTLKPAKLLVIDDGSTDNSPDIIRRVLRDCPFEAEFIERENRGLTKTLNEGFSRLSDSEFFAYLSSDDIWFPRFLERRIQLLKNHPDASLIFGHAFLIDENNQIIDSTSDWFDFNEKEILDHLIKGEIFSSPSVVYRTEFLKRHKWNEEALLEDYELYLKLALESRFVFDAEILCAWRQHKSNTSRNFPKMMHEWLSAQDRVLKGIMSDKELKKAQTALRFKSVADCVRFGYKREAVRLFLENLTGAESLSQFVGIILRLITPQFLFQANRQRKKHKNIKQYGTLEEQIACEASFHSQNIFHS